MRILIILLSKLFNIKYSDLHKRLYTNNLSRSNKFRIKSTFIFKLIRWLYTTRDIKDTINLNNSTEHLSKSLDYTDSINEYILEIYSTIPDWDIYSKLYNIHTNIAYSVYSGRCSDGEFIGLKGSLEHTALLCYAAGNMKLAVHDYRYKSYYSKLLRGVCDCFLVSGDEVHLRRLYKDEYISNNTTLSLEIISAVVLLISGFDKFKDDFIEDLEFHIKLWFDKFLTTHDYIISKINNDNMQSDISPNIIYNSSKCFAYVAARLIQPLKITNELSILKEVLLSPVMDHYILNNLLVCRAIAAANMLEAIFNMYPDKNNSIGMSKHVFCELSIRWLTNINNKIGLDIPELHAVKSIFYMSYGDIVSAELEINKTQAIINILYDNRTLVKNENYRCLLNPTHGGDSPTDMVNGDGDPCSCCDCPLNVCDKGITFTAFDYPIIYSKIADYLVKKYT